MAATGNGIQVDPPTEASNPANSTSTLPDVPNATALTNAIEQGNINAVQALIERGADVNSPLLRQGTVLQAALQLAEPQIDCVKFLLENGANIYSTGDGGSNALALAVARRLDNVLDLMIDGGYIRTEVELPTDQRLPFDFTILHVAACFRNVRALERLLETPAREMVNDKNNMGQTPLHLATRPYSTFFDYIYNFTRPRYKIPPIPDVPYSIECEIAQLLVNNGARGDISDENGHTALENSLRNFNTYDMAKIVFPASVGPSGWTEMLGHVLRKPDAHILHSDNYWGERISLMTTNDLQALNTSQLSFNRCLLFPEKSIAEQEQVLKEDSLLLLSEHQSFVTDKPGLSCQWWHRVEEPSCRIYWVVHRALMPRRSEFEAFKIDHILHDFIACRFVTNCPILSLNDDSWLRSSDTQLDQTTIKIVSHYHVLLWAMVKYRPYNKPIMLRSTALITTTQHAERTTKVCNLLTPFAMTLMEEWTRMFKNANEHLLKMRSVILTSRGHNPLVIDHLLHDALLWVQVEEVANKQKRDLMELNALFVAEELESFGAALSEFYKYLAEGVKNLRDTSQELIGLEFNLTSIREAQKSTSTSVSMKRLSWITFIFLPLTFVSSLFGMNVNVLESNPPWWIYLPFAFSTLGLTMIVWLTFKRYPSIEDKAERVFRKLTR
ncbi:hypothetical protein CEP52_005339 [Fusarium oligoseptatum]|uniref:Uncharacterized protein n=1 Tax=Fusarium oligoseptatum TaxID=2604345 RepID=A0A428TYY7_9HYPO|nr:hypothetical protein CEP52_005339 [Fusarium oligoseptatum]